MKLTLSPRLRQIADFVRAGDRVIDVGTDHAYIPIWLLQNNICTQATATDIKPGPLQRAALDAEKYAVSDRLSLLLCDGLSACSPEMADTIILAGMGGETIASILDAAPWAWEKRLILQPQTKLGMLRSWLAEHGLAVRDAALVDDAGRIYLIWLVETGKMARLNVIDSVLVEKKDPLLRAYAESLIKRLRKQIFGMEQASATDLTALDVLRRELADVTSVFEEASTWQP